MKDLLVDVYTGRKSIQKVRDEYKQKSEQVGIVWGIKEDDPRIKKEYEEFYNFSRGKWHKDEWRKRL
ncbi:hypothetical protein MYX76_09520 [Desulfobacterota bacterium AH_259_B03_O07]|nr:hypothetical protein [Desulfobacterota bacterium AH_259_B03_O07]